MVELKTRSPLERCCLAVDRCRNNASYSLRQKHYPRQRQWTLWQATCLSFVSLSPPSRSNVPAPQYCPAPSNGRSTNFPWATCMFCSAVLYAPQIIAQQSTMNDWLIAPFVGASRARCLLSADERITSPLTDRAIAAIAELDSRHRISLCCYRVVALLGLFESVYPSPYKYSPKKGPRSRAYA